MKVVILAGGLGTRLPLETVWTILLKSAIWSPRISAVFLLVSFIDDTPVSATWLRLSCFWPSRNQGNFPGCCSGWNSGTLAHGTESQQHRDFNSYWWGCDGNSIPYGLFSSKKYWLGRACAFTQQGDCRSGPLWRPAECYTQSERFAKSADGQWSGFVIPNLKRCTLF